MPRPKRKRSRPNVSRALIRPRNIFRWSLLFCALLFLAGIAGTITHAELTDEEKKQLFLKSRERMRTVPADAGEIGHPAGQAEAREKTAGEEEKVDPKTHRHDPARGRGNSRPHPAAESRGNTDANAATESRTHPGAPSAPD